MFAMLLVNRRWLLLILTLSLLARVVAALWLGDQANAVSGASDQTSYDTLAQRLLAGKGFSFPTDWYPFTRANEPTAHWSFLYTLYLAGVYAIVGHHPLAARLLQVLVSILNLWLTYRIGRRLFGEWSGVAAAALAGVYAYLLFFSAVLMTQSFYVLALLVSINLALELAKHSRRMNWIFLGLALGVGILLRQTLLLFTPILFAWLWWKNKNASETIRIRSRVSGFLIALGVIAALVLPWTLRNYFVYQDFLLLNSNGGFWLYSSNHPAQGTNFNPNYVAPLPENLQGLSEPSLDRALYREAFRFIVADPTRFLLLTLNRFKDYFWLLPAEQSSLISNFSRLFSFTLYLPLFLYGLVLSRGNWRACLPLYLYVGFDAALHLTSWAAPRYRLPSDAVMMVFAGLAATDLLTRVHAIVLRWIPPRARASVTDNSSQKPDLAQRTSPSHHARCGFR